MQLVLPSKDNFACCRAVVLRRRFAGHGVFNPVLLVEMGECLKVMFDLLEFIHERGSRCFIMITKSTIS